MNNITNSVSFLLLKFQKKLFSVMVAIFDVHLPCTAFLMNTIQYKSSNWNILYFEHTLHIHTLHTLLFIICFHSFSPSVERYSGVK